MNSDRQLPRLPYDEPDPDPATRAFTRLEGEMAMMRRAALSSRRSISSRKPPLRPGSVSPRSLALRTSTCRLTPL